MEKYEYNIYSAVDSSVRLGTFDIYLPCSVWTSASCLSLFLRFAALTRHANCHCIFISISFPFVCAFSANYAFACNRPTSDAFTRYSTDSLNMLITLKCVPCVRTKVTWMDSWSLCSAEQYEEIETAAVKRNARDGHMQHSGERRKEKWF